MSDNFQIFRGSSIRLWSRRVCSSGLTSSQYLRSRMPESTIAFSTPGASSRKRRVSSGVQNPITRSTPARLYQLRSKITTSPAAGKCNTYRCMYICDFSRSVGAGKATTRNTLGLTRSVMALIVPPLPAVSRPSNTMQTLAPVSLTHSWTATSSACRRRSSCWYSFCFIFGTVGGRVAPFPSGPAALPRGRTTIWAVCGTTILRVIPLVSAPIRQSPSRFRPFPSFRSSARLSPRVNPGTRRR